jgi:hypothetical protein
MANFYQHSFAGAISGLIYAVFIVSVGWAESQWIALLLFAVAIIGAFLPDLDHDEGIPVRIIFGLLATLTATLAIYWHYLKGGFALWYILIAGLLIFAVVWFGVKRLFKMATHHRGIYHSIPAILIAALLAMELSRQFLDDIRLIQTIGGAMAVGYFTHLLLDEIFGTVTMTGRPFRSARVTASPLSYRSNSLPVTLIAWALVILLIWRNLDFLKEWLPG